MSRRRLPSNVRAVMGALRDARFTSAVANGKRKHFKIEWRDLNGHRRVLVMSASPSDRNAEAQALRDVKRVLRQMSPIGAPEMGASHG